MAGRFSSRLRATAAAAAALAAAGTLSTTLWAQTPAGAPIKIGVLTVVFGTGAYNWLRVRPALGTQSAAGRLRRSAVLELTVGAIVLAVTAVLVATPPPADTGTGAMQDVSAAAAQRPANQTEH